MKRWLGPLAISLIVLTGIGMLLSRSEEAREVAGSAMLSFFTFFMTPFVLESTVALLGLVALLSYNQWRREKDGDDWVEMEVPDQPAADPSESK